MSRSRAWLARAIFFLCRVALIVWTTLAIYFSNLPWAELRLALAMLIAAFSIWAFSVLAQTVHPLCTARIVRRCRRVVGFHRTVARPPVAAGGCRDAARGH